MITFPSCIASKIPATDLRICIDAVVVSDFIVSQISSLVNQESVRACLISSTFFLSSISLETNDSTLLVRFVVLN